MGRSAASLPQWATPGAYFALPAHADDFGAYNQKDGQHARCPARPPQLQDQWPEWRRKTGTAIAGLCPDHATASRLDADFAALPGPGRHADASTVAAMSKKLRPAA
jgi:hypothetical protein